MTIQLPVNSSGTIVDTATLGGKDRELVVLAGDGAVAEVAGVVLTQPTETEYGLVTRGFERVDGETLSVANLGISGVFTGAWNDANADGVAFVEAAAFADEVSAGSGFVIEGSDDSSDGNFTRTLASATVSVSTLETIQAAIPTRFWRVKYTNGGSAQGSFRLTVAARNRVVPAVDSTGQAQVDVVSSTSVIDPNNSTATPLGSSATFTGTATDVLAYSSVTVQLFADEDGATDGMTFEFSIDGTNWDVVHTHTYTASEGRVFQFASHTQFFRIVFINGTTGQGVFRVETLLHPNIKATTIHRLMDPTSPDRSAELVKSAILAQAAGSGDFVPVQATAAGNFKIAIEEAEGNIVGGGSEATALRVTIANNSTGLLSVDGSGFTQPISAASLPLPAGAATSAAQLADGHNVTIDNAAAGAAVNIQDGGNTITVDASALDIRALTNTDVVTVEQSSATSLKAEVIGTGTFAVQDSEKVADLGPFVSGTTPVQPIGYVFDDIAGTAPSENDIVAARVDVKRAQAIVLEDGSTRGQVAAVSAGGALTVDGSGVTQPVSAASLPLPAGAATSANQLADDHNVTVSNGAAGAAVNIQDGGNTITVDGTVSVDLNASTNTIEVVGDEAHGAAVAGNPLLQGAEARTTLPTAVSDGEAVRVQADDQGRLVTAPFSPRDLVVQGRVELTSTSETTVLALDASNFHDLVLATLTNESGTAVRVDIRDATAGTVRESMFLAADGGGAVIPFPATLPQAASNNNWTAQLSSAVTSVYVTLVAVKRA